MLLFLVDRFWRTLEDNIELHLQVHDSIQEPWLDQYPDKRRYRIFLFWAIVSGYFPLETFAGLAWFHDFNLDSYFATAHYIPHKVFPENFWQDMRGCLAIVFGYSFLSDYHILKHRSISPKHTMLLFKYGEEDRLYDRYRKLYIPQAMASHMIEKRRRMFRQARIGVYFCWIPTMISYQVNIKAWTFYDVFINFIYTGLLLFSTIVDMWQGMVSFSLNCCYMKQFLREELQQLNSLKSSHPFILLKLYQKHRQIASIMAYLSGFWKQRITVFSSCMIGIVTFIIFQVFTGKSRDFQGYALVLFWAPFISSFLVTVSFLGNNLVHLNREIHKNFYRELNRFLEKRMLQKYSFKMRMIMESSIEEFDSKNFGFHYGNSTLVCVKILLKLLHQASLVFVLIFLYRLNL